MQTPTSIFVVSNTKHAPCILMCFCGDGCSTGNKWVTAEMTIVQNYQHAVSTMDSSTNFQAPPQAAYFL